MSFYVTVSQVYFEIRGVSKLLATQCRKKLNASHEKFLKIEEHKLIEIKLCVSSFSDFKTLVF